MNFKPQILFMSVLELFSILIPGTIAVLIIYHYTVRGFKASAILLSTKSAHQHIATSTLLPNTKIPKYTLQQIIRRNLTRNFPEMMLRMSNIDGNQI